MRANLKKINLPVHYLSISDSVNVKDTQYYKRLRYIERLYIYFVIAFYTTIHINEAI